MQVSFYLSLLRYIIPTIPYFLFLYIPTCSRNTDILYTEIKS